MLTVNVAIVCLFLFTYGASTRIKRLSLGSYKVTLYPVWVSENTNVSATVRLSVQNDTNKNIGHLKLALKCPLKALQSIYPLTVSGCSVVSGLMSTI